MLDELLGRYRTPMPRQVAGFDHAMANGLVPVVPAAAPEPAGALSATDVSMNMVYGFVGCGVAFVLVSLLANQFGLLVVSPLFIAVLAAFGYVLFKMPRETVGSYLAETQLGYTTTKGVVQTGLRDTTELPLKHVMLPWDFSGVWRLDSQGSVVTPPDRRFDPPGYYPSPHLPGKYELWTGVMWTGSYTD